MGIADAYELGWKLSAVIQGFSHSGLLTSYEAERRPVALASIKRSEVHMQVHMDMAKILGDEPAAVDEDTPRGKELRQALIDHYARNNGENTDLGIEMGHCYKSSVIVPDKSAEAPEQSPPKYKPTTYPGSRAPHVYLRDGTALFDHYGKWYTLVDFSEAGSQHGASLLIDSAAEYWLPIKHLQLMEEEHAYEIWGRRLVLVRPDGHVAWRGDECEGIQVARDIIAVVSGQNVKIEADAAMVMEKHVNVNLNGTENLKGIEDGVVGGVIASKADAEGDGELLVESDSKPEASTATMEVMAQKETFEMEKMVDIQM